MLMFGVEVKSEADLVGPGAAVGTVPTDLEQATGLERLEILGKMQGVDIFDMKPLDASRKGTHSLHNQRKLGRGYTTGC
jgi:cytochrome c oxidase subunit 5b